MTAATTKQYVHPDAEVTVEATAAEAEKYVSQGWAEKPAKK